MLLDLQNLCSDKQSIVGTAASAIVSTNTVDFGVTGTVPGGLVGALIDDPGRAFWMEAWCQITTTVLATGGAANVTFDIIQSANADLSSPDVLQTTGAIAKATLIAGYRPQLRGAFFSKRYGGFRYTPDTHDTTAGNVSATFGIRGGAQSNPQV